MGRTKIEWTATLGQDGTVHPGYSFNPWIGCAKVSPACDRCYAESWAKRSGLVTWGGPRRRTAPATWAQPIRWNRHAAETGVRYKVFCASLADVFDSDVPAQWRADLFALIRETPNLTWLLLSKRIGNAKRMLPADWHNGYSNVALGSTIANQTEADRDTSKLLAIPASVHFVSCEPLLGEVDFSCIPWPATRQVIDDPSEGFDALRYRSGPHIDWVIVGGESGHGARPPNPAWVRSLRDECRRARVPFFFKQWGQFMPSDDPATAPIRVHSKHAAGRLLDGRTWNETPFRLIQTA